MNSQTPFTDNDAFYEAVGRTDFPERYYGLCTHYGVRADPTPRATKANVVTILSEMGRSPKFDSRDKSYSFDQKASGGILHLGFCIQSYNIIEFWLWVERGDLRLGSNYAVIAHMAAKCAGKSTPTPPYPRPDFSNLDELRHILAECFMLSDTLIPIL